MTSHKVTIWSQSNHRLRAKKLLDQYSPFSYPNLMRYLLTRTTPPLDIHNFLINQPWNNYRNLCTSYPIFFWPIAPKITPMLTKNLSILMVSSPIFGNLIKLPTKIAFILQTITSTTKKLGTHTQRTLTHTGGTQWKIQRKPVSCVSQSVSDQ